MGVFPDKLKKRMIRTRKNWHSATKKRLRSNSLAKFFLP
jgi:hypothetical protein